jgi:hypothetical protein
MIDIPPIPVSDASLVPTAVIVLATIVAVYIDLELSEHRQG